MQGCSSLSLLLPARHQIVRDTQVIKHAGYDRIDDLLDILGASIERRVGRKDRRARLNEELEVFDVNQIEGCFAGDKDELLAFFQNDVGSAEQHVFAVAVGDSAERPHAARDDHHGVGSAGSAGKRGVHALEVVGSHTRRPAQAAGKFFGYNRRSVMAEHDVDLVLGRIEIVEQTLGIQRTAGSGDSDKYSQEQLMIEL